MLCVFSLLPPLSMPTLASLIWPRPEELPSLDEPPLSITSCSCWLWLFWGEGKANGMGKGQKGEEGSGAVSLFHYQPHLPKPPLPPPPTDLTPRPGRASQTTYWLSVSCLSDWQDIHSVHGAQLWLKNRADIIVVSKCNVQKLHLFNNWLINRLLGGIWIFIK